MQARPLNAPAAGSPAPRADRPLRARPLPEGTPIVIRDLTIRTTRPRKVERKLGDVRGVIQPRSDGLVGDGPADWRRPPRPAPTRDKQGRYLVKLEVEPGLVFAHESELVVQD